MDYVCSDNFISAAISDQLALPRYNLPMAISMQTVSGSIVSVRHFFRSVLRIGDLKVSLALKVIEGPP